MQDLFTINTTLEISYIVKSSDGLFLTDNLDISNCCVNRRTVLIIDKKIIDLYGDSIKIYFDYHGIQYLTVVIDGIESCKNTDSLFMILRAMEQFGISRRDEPIIGIGGGVIQDLVGLAATLYRRGVPYIRVPTTLLGIVDVSVAAKTGINFEDRRNRLGSYYPPVASFLDKSFLATLGSIEISSGLGEILKMAIIKDSHLFNILETHGTELLEQKFNNPYADEVISRSIQGMKEELENNLWEKNLKRIVDFGHSFSPIIEMRSLNKKEAEMLTHGQAVTLDMIFSCVLSYSRNMISLDNLVRIIKTARSMDLPTYYDDFSNPDLLLESLQDTMKHRNGDQNLPIPIDIGNSVFINDLSYSEIVTVAALYVKINKDVDGQ